MGMEAKRLGALAVIGARGRAPWAKLTAETKDRGGEGGRCGHARVLSELCGLARSCWVVGGIRDKGGKVKRRKSECCSTGMGYRHTPYGLLDPYILPFSYAFVSFVSLRLVSMHVS